LSARRLAFTALQKWRGGKSFADSILAELFNRTRQIPQDRAFSQELFYGVLRNVTLLDFWIGCVRRGRLSADLRDILRIGFYQLFLLETPRHAAVHETVELAPTKHRALINAVLRTALRDDKELRQRATEQPLPIQWSHPEFLLARWRINFGEAATVDLCAWNNRPAPVYARINRLKISPNEFLQTYPDSFTAPDRGNFVGMPVAISEATKAGNCYVQDPSTAVACELLEPEAGENVLDACAAPGGKTGYLAELMQNRGRILACDRDKARLQILENNLSQLRVKNTRLVCHDWVTDHVPREVSDNAPFDRILVDTPCSNTGVMRRRVDVRWRLRESDFARMQQRQLKILNAVTRLLKPGGVIVYSTCSIESEENEQVIEQFTAQSNLLRLDKKVQLLPFRDHFDGAFAAGLIKSG
jgi:16S rRNA (cytosine967-C5)-methyltransferase